MCKASPCTGAAFSAAEGRQRVIATARYRIVLVSQSVRAEARKSWWCATACAEAGHTLRFYITPPFGKCHPVTTLKLRFVGATASRPSGFQKMALCKVPCLAWASSLRATRYGRGYAPSPRASRRLPAWCASIFLQSVCFAHVGASRLVLPPLAHPSGIAALRACNARRVAHPVPPQGGPSLHTGGHLSFRCACGVPAPHPLPPPRFAGRGKPRSAQRPGRRAGQGYPTPKILRRCHKAGRQ